MKNAAMFLVAFMLCVAALIGCGTTNPTPQSREPIIPSTTTVSDAATRGALSAYDPESGTLRFTQSTPTLASLKPDDVLVSEPSGAAPGGYLRKVKAVRQEGGAVVLETTQANLTDAIHQGDLHAEADLTGDDLEATSAFLNGVSITPNPVRPQVGTGEGFHFRLSFNRTFVPVSSPNARGQIVVDGLVEFNLGYRVDVGISGCLEIPPICVDSFEARAGFSQRSSLRISGDMQGQLGASVKVGSQSFKAMVFFIGPVPVVLIPRVDLYLSVSGQVQVKFEFQASQSATAQLGARWTDDHGWRDISDFGLRGEVRPPSFSGTLKPRAAARSSFSIKLYDVAGPEVSLEAGLELDGQVPRNPTWIVNGFLKGTLGFKVKLPIIGTLADYQTTLFETGRELARSANTPPNLELTDQTRPLPGSSGTLRSLDLGVPVSFLPGCDAPGVFFFVVRDAEDGCNLRVTLHSDRDGPLTLRPTFGTVGPRTLTVTVQDSGGASARASFAVDIVNSPPSILGGLGTSTVQATVPLYFKLQALDPNSGLLECGAITITGGPVQTVSAQGGDCRYVVTFNTPGQQALTVTATDPQGLSSAPKTFGLTVTDPPPVPAPTWVPPGLEARGSDGRLIPDNGYVNCFEIITLSARAVDAAGRPVTYTWGASVNGAPLVILTPDADGKLRVSYTTRVLFSVIASNGKALSTVLTQAVRWPPASSCPPPGPK